MLHPSYTDLMRIVNDEAEGDTPVVNSRYTIVMATAKRAREIISEGDDEAEYGPDHQKMKPLSQAVKELSEGRLRIVPEGEPDEEEIEAQELPEDGEALLDDGQEFPDDEELQGDGDEAPEDAAALAGDDGSGAEIAEDENA